MADQGAALVGGGGVNSAAFVFGHGGGGTGQGRFIHRGFALNDNAIYRHPTATSFSGTVYCWRLRSTQAVSGMRSARLCRGAMACALKRTSSSWQAAAKIKIAAAEGKERAVIDYIAGMTDHYAVTVFSDIYIPKAWSI